MQITNVGYKQFKSDKRFAVARSKYIIQINLKGKSKGEKKEEEKDNDTSTNNN